MKALLQIFKLQIDSKRIYGLDILRAAAILFVVITHGSLLLPASVANINSYFVFDGVSIFFVLSGYLIGYILIKIVENQKANLANLFNFWIRRWFRTLPNYFFILTLLLILSYFLIPEFKISEYTNYYYFSQNINSIHPNFFPEAWSLTIEEWFYLIIPIIIFSLIGILKIKPKTSALISVIFLIIIITAFRYYKSSLFLIDNIQDWDNLFRKQVLTRLDSLIYGVLAAYFHFYYENYWLKYKWPTFILGIILLVLIRILSIFNLHGFGLYFTVFSFSLASIATAFLLPLLSQIKQGKGIIYKSLTYISLISYSLYLTHLTLVQNFILPHIDFTTVTNNPNFLIILKYIAYWIISIVISTLLFKYFEIPTTKLREKFNFKKD